MKKRIAGWLLALCMVFALLPTGTFAADIVDSGSCGANGDNVTWTLDSNGLLTISGTGAMGDWFEDSPFYYNDAIHAVVIEAGVTSIGEHAFYGCKNLTSVTIPNSVASIGDSAFGNCLSLASITIPNGVTTIGDSAFYQCALTSIAIPDSVTSVGRGAFIYCAHLTSITFGSGVNTLPMGLEGCSNLTSIRVSDDNPYYRTIDNVLFSKDGTKLLLCLPSREGVYAVPSGVKSIEPSAFGWCHKLTSVTIPEGVTSIGEWAFAGCDGLQRITIPNSLASIGNYAFWNNGVESEVSISDVYYNGTQEEWAAIQMEGGNNGLTDAAIHYHSHTWSAWTVTKPATETAEGIETRTCAVCGATETRSIPKLTPKPADPTPAPTVNFVDVQSGAYYADAVAWAVVKGVTNGTSDTTFSPNDTCTRAQVVTFLWRAAGSPEPKSTANPFTDVDVNSYYGKAVLWAVEQNITKGTSDTTFSPAAGCTRGQVVTFLHRAKGTPAAKNSANPFTDVAAGTYYYDAVLWAVEQGITNGTSDTTFSPNDTCTRGQIVTFLYRDMK